ncbi:MAG: hypothetical protein SGARI_000728 [Bacillariaceae sp.]
MSSASHLAPFVAAALKDKTVEELMQKVEQQELALQKMMKVEITGPQGTPVYAEGQFEQGNYDDGILSDALTEWCVKMARTEAVEWPLRNLRGLELRLGGVIQFSVNPEHDQKTSFSFMEDSLFIDADDGTKLFLTIEGCDESQWEAMLVMDHRTTEKALEALESLPDSCTLEYGSLVFSLKKYQALVDTMPQTNEQKIRLQKHQDRESLRQRVKEVAPNLGNGTQSRILVQLTSGPFNFTKISEESELILQNLVQVFVVHEKINWIAQVQLESDISNLARDCGVGNNNAENQGQALERFVSQLEKMAQRYRSRIGQDVDSMNH